jgi:hypothetical protein
MSIIAVVIAVSSLVVDLRGSVHSFESGNLAAHDQLKSLWAEGTLPYNTGDRYSKGMKFIAQEFMPIVVLAEPTDAETSFSHYLPVYRLHRQKEYFLLI